MVNYEKICSVAVLSLFLVSQTIAADSRDSFSGAFVNSPQSVTMQECQDRADEFARTGYCGQGDLACVARLEYELKSRVERTCVRAIEELKPPPQRYPLP